jgi:hypothetical protein
VSDGGKIDPRRVEAIVAKIKPLLAGEPPKIQGGVLVDLLATTRTLCVHGAVQLDHVSHRQYPETDSSGPIDRRLIC